ncbi:enoyl-CoA hydratase/isomerase family protein [Polaromonas sp.]|uniref:enoyl-CoA hydratase/isomerase family protein n=1 Tax=Polaromonas sp. TaxID=1869339 RepID=UPI001D7C3AA6|nr:enoyl-CoA hydratase/isomerase family protein [Polaromonas sp.]MBT9476202.1 enoyl-CoA hydratase/isomerase family protein [Polaromonas sp.]
MSGAVSLDISGAVAFVTLSHPGKFNAMSRAMWRELRAVFESVQQDCALRAVLVRGEGGHFCAGGDISEYAAFRFDEASLRDFHEREVWGGLQAMLACDLPIVAQIEGNCMGAGVEIASCCDLRLASDAARFGAPIARLGFPMAPREAALVMRAVGELTAREMLLSAAVLGAAEMKQRGFLNQVVPATEVQTAALACLDRIRPLAPQAARLNKQAFRALAPVLVHEVASDLVATAYDYAPSAEHREGVTAFIEKRSPQFSD